MKDVKFRDIGVDDFGFESRVEGVGNKEFECCNEEKVCVDFGNNGMEFLVGLMKVFYEEVEIKIEKQVGQDIVKDSSLDDGDQVFFVVIVMFFVWIRYFMFGDQYREEDDFNDGFKSSFNENFSYFGYFVCKFLIGEVEEIGSGNDSNIGSCKFLEVQVWEELENQGYRDNGLQEVDEYGSGVGILLEDGEEVVWMEVGVVVFVFIVMFVVMVVVISRKERRGFVMVRCRFVVVVGWYCGFFC